MTTLTRRILSAMAHAFFTTALAVLNEEMARTSSLTGSAVTKSLEHKE